MSATSIEDLDLSKLNEIAAGDEVRRRTLINRSDKLKKEEQAAAAAAVRTASAPKKHISDEPFTFSNWYQHIHWINTTLVALIPLFGICMIPFTHLYTKTLILSVLYYAVGGLGITAGYHRCFAHRSYSARFPLKLLLVLMGSAAGQGSVKWWSNGHRTHHRFTDTDKDPYNAKQGFWHSHMGWMIFLNNPKLKGRTDISDLIADPLIKFQHKHYLMFLAVMGFVVPTLIAGLGWGDYKGGFIYAGILRLFCIHQSTFCVNSLAHWIGEQPFDDRHTPRDHVITALVTFGEGYHNFHHQFPSDYRNAIKWYQYDPTKVFIWTMKQIGLAYNLQKFSQNAIEQGLVQQQQKKLDRWRATLNWGVPIEQLPVMEFDDFKAEAKARNFVLISGIVHDVTDFVDKHPGGRALISSGIGRDATAVFNGGVYDHSNAAHNLLATMRVGVIRGGCEVEVWKKARDEKTDVNIEVSSSGEKIVRAGDQPTRVTKVAVSGRAA